MLHEHIFELEKQVRELQAKLGIALTALSHIASDEPLCDSCNPKHILGDHYWTVANNALSKILQRTK